MSSQRIVRFDAVFLRRARAPLRRAGLALSGLAAVVPVAACGSAIAVTPLCTGPGPASRVDTFASTVSMLTLPYGLRYGDATVGCGSRVRPGQNVTVQYTGWLQDGAEFDSSRTAGRQALTFQPGQQQVIRGFEVGVLNMRVGGKRRLEIPPALAYGTQGVPPVIPANATLIIDVEVINAS